MLIYKVKNEHIEDMWPHVFDLLEKPLKRTNNEHCMANLYDWLMADYQQLWVGVDDNKEVILAFTTQIMEFPHHKRLRGLLAGSKPHTIDKWFDEGIPVIEDFCRENDIKFSEFQVRDGWIPFFKKHDFYKYYVVMAKEIK